MERTPDTGDRSLTSTCAARIRALATDSDSRQLLPHPKGPRVDAEHRPAEAVAHSLEHLAAASVGLASPARELPLCRHVPHLCVQLSVEPWSWILDVVCSVG